MQLYDRNGWIESSLIVHNKAAFVLAIGGRGIGKSYGVLKRLYEEKIPFIYMRRTLSQLEAVTVPALSPFNQINADCGYNVVVQKNSKYTVGFYDGVINKEGKVVADGSEFAIGIALSVFAQTRGMSAEKYNVLLFDEIIQERHEKRINQEGLAFANCLESLNRNRELSGREPLKVIMLSNSNTLDSQIISTIGCTDIVDTMARRHQTYKEVNNGDIAIIRYEDSPISERKADTALYRVIKNKDFQSMALDNEFAEADYEHVAQRPLQEYKLLCSVGDCTICKHKSKPEYYVIAGVKAQERYSMLPIDKEAFQHKYIFVYSAWSQKRVFFQSATAKLEFERAFDI